MILGHRRGVTAVRRERHRGVTVLRGVHVTRVTHERGSMMGA